MASSVNQKSTELESIDLYDKKLFSGDKKSSVPPALVQLALILRKRTPPGNISKSFSSMRYDPKTKILRITGFLRKGGYAPEIVTDSGDLVDDAWNAIASAKCVSEVHTTDIVFDYPPHRDWFKQNNILLVTK